MTIWNRAGMRLKGRSWAFRNPKVPNGPFSGLTVLLAPLTLDLNFLADETLSGHHQVLMFLLFLGFGKPMVLTVSVLPSWTNDEDNH
jgi:hypothetical protein